MKTFGSFNRPNVVRKDSSDSNYLTPTMVKEIVYKKLKDLKKKMNA